MAHTFNHVDRGTYLDSVALMRVSRRVAALPGVQEASLMMASPTNKELLQGAGLLEPAGGAAGANDLIIAVRAATAAEAKAAVDAAQAMLAEKTENRSTGPMRARSLAGAANLLAGANLALISVPGDYAPLEARRALQRGLHVLMFSDNVPLNEELALKQFAHEQGLLLMGPDCGTAMIAGLPIAFANVVPRGSIGIVAASGTGLQEVACLIARAGGGVSHGIGVGGRDLYAQIGGITTLDALDALAHDPTTQAIVLISKPPAPEVARRVLAHVATINKPCVVCFLGLPNADMPANAKFASTLCEAAEAALGFPVAADPLVLPKRAGKVRGLFCGGTLCAEAQIVFLAQGLAVGSNAPVPGATASAAHQFLDLGDDEYTQGKPHPMLEPDIRNDHVRQALLAADTAVVLIDMVIGYGAHEDPASVLVAALGPREGRVPVIASVTGTAGDPQGYARQVGILQNAGVVVAASNAHAASLAASIVA